MSSKIARKNRKSAFLTIGRKLLLEKSVFSFDRERNRNLLGVERLHAREMLAADLVVEQPLEYLVSQASVEQSAGQLESAVDRSADKVRVIEAANQQPISVDYWLVTWSEDSEPTFPYGPTVVKSIQSTDLIDDARLVRFQQSFNEAEMLGQLGITEQPSLTYPLVSRQRSTRLIPNDSLFFDQWHLLNTTVSPGQPAEDLNVVPAWDIVTGDGVVIGVIDEGVEYTHPDLANKYRADLSFDYFSLDADPAANRFSEWHGTAVAGVAAAETNNVEGVAGVAPDAEFAAIRLIVGETTDAQEAASLAHALDDIHIYNNSWGPTDIGFIDPLDQPGPLALAAIENGITNGRDGLGAIYVWAGGNGAQNFDNVNYDLYANSRYTIAVGAIGFDGTQSFYSEPGAPLLVVAPSNDSTIGITTTDITDLEGYSSTDYTDDFGGTSSAAPAVAGVVALMLEANPDLTYRDVQHVLVHSARQNDPTDTDWVQNGSGLWVNHKYGFGAVDAEAAVQLATVWEPIGQEFTYETPLLDVDALIPDADPTGVSFTFPVPANFSVEYVEVVAETTHQFVGDLVMSLTSPLGTVSQLTELNNGQADWTLRHGFTSARHWDEPSFGNWTVNIFDDFAVFDGTVDRIGLRIYGNQRPVIGPSITVADAFALESSGELQFDVILSEPSPVDVTFDALTSGITAEDGVDFLPLNFTPFTIPAGDLSTTVTVPILDDSILELDETLFFATVNVKGALSPLVAATGTILNDDQPTTVDATPWRNLGPRGTEARFSDNNFVVLTSDLDSSELRFGGQSRTFVSATAIPTNPDVVISFELLDPDGQSVAGPFTASGPGQSLFLPTTTLFDDGTFALRFAADQATDIEVELLMNAVSEDQFGDTDPASQSIDSSALQLGNTRYVVRGTLEDLGINVSTNVDDTLFVDISTTGTALNLGDDQVVTINTSVGNRILPAGPVRVSNNGVVIAGDAGIPNHVNSNLPVTAFDTVLAPFWDDLSAVGAGDVFWEELEINGVDALVIQWNQRAHFNFPNAGTITFQMQVFSEGELKVRYAYQDVTFADNGTLPAIDAGASATIGLQRGTDDVHVISFNQAVVSDGTFVDFNIPDDSDLYAVDLSNAVGNEIDIFVDGLESLRLAGQAVLELIGPTGDVLATGSAFPGGVPSTNYDIGIANFQVTLPGVYNIRIADSGLGNYVIGISEAMVFDTEINNQASAQLRKLAAQTSAYGHLLRNDDQSSDVDYYSIDLTTADRLILQTQTPYDAGIQGLANELNPSITVFGPRGELFLADSDSAADGKNAFLRVIPDLDGTYVIGIESQEGSGSYFLGVSNWLNKAPTNIVLSPASIPENTDTSAGDVLIGSLTTLDPDPLDTKFTYELINGPTANDNRSFMLQGDQLYLLQGVVLDFETKPFYVIRVQTTDEFGDTFEQNILVNVRNLLELESITVNDNDQQRSRVDSVTITFDGRATIAPDAFMVNRRGVTGGPVDVDFTTMVNANNQTVATLVFSGGLTEFGSLRDGNYELIVDAMKVTSLSGTALDGDRDGQDGGNVIFGADEADGFFRLFGDTNGDRAVGVAEYGQLRRAFGSAAGDAAFVDFLDFNDDDIVGSIDFNEFKSRLGKRLTFE